MRKFGLALALGAAAGTGVLMMGRLQAMPLPQLGEAAADLSSVEKSQFIYGGRNYCFYLDGWRGPGFYWCGYAHRRGLGWGGPEGWRGWHNGGHGGHGGGGYRGGGHGGAYHGGGGHGGAHGGGHAGGGHAGGGHGGGGHGGGGHGGGGHGHR
jgi:hypothetical protein